MAYNLQTGPGNAIVQTLSKWIDAYREQHVQYSHDQAMMTLLTPDESILIVGPPRLVDTNTGENVGHISINDATKYYVVGFANNINYTETAAVQPMKAIGSRRHVFSKTNAPVQGSIGRMMILGASLMRALYKKNNAESAVSSESLQRVSGSSTDSGWYTNLEEDIFRVPFGLGVIYGAPATLDKGTVFAGDYIECCVLTSRQSNLQTGGAMIMENVSFMADRILPGFVNTTVVDGVNPWATMSSSISDV